MTYIPDDDKPYDNISSDALLSWSLLLSTILSDFILYVSRTTNFILSVQSKQYTDNTINKICLDRIRREELWISLKEIEL